MDGTDGSTTFTDESGKTWTARDNAQIDTAQSKFGGASGLFDGNGDFIDTPTSTDFNFGTGDFTIDFWIKFASTASQQGIMGSCADTNNIFQMWFFGNAGGGYNYKWSFYWKDGGTVRGWYQVSSDQSDPGTGWHHVAWVRSGSSAYFFLDGTSIALTQYNAWGTLTNINSAYHIGDASSAAGCASQYYTNGWFDEVRISKGIARWTSNFHPQSSAYAPGVLVTTAATNNGDAEITSANPTTNYGSQVYLMSQRNSDGSRPWRPLIHFTLPSGSGTITAVKLFLYKYLDVSGWSLPACELHEVTQTGWTEAGATWNKYDGTNNWATAGGDYSATVVDTTNAPIAYGSYGWENWDLGPGATNPISGLTWGSHVDLGLYYTPGTLEQSYTQWYSKEGTANYLPYIEITYTPNTCTYSSGNWNVACSDNCIITSNVNLGNSNLLFTGSGVFTMNADITNFNQIAISSGCKVAIANGKKFG